MYQMVKDLKTAPKAEEAEVVAPTAESVSEPTAEDDDAMSFFAKLAQED